MTDRDDRPPGWPVATYTPPTVAPDGDAALRAENARLRDAIRLIDNYIVIDALIEMANGGWPDVDDDESDLRKACDGDMDDGVFCGRRACESLGCIHLKVLTIQSAIDALDQQANNPPADAGAREGT